jgi:acyl-CoA thioesterase I
MTRPATLVFTGDSITATDRAVSRPESLGHGYVRMVAEHLRVTRAALCLNTGIGGNRIRDLVRRWGSDVAGLAPDVLTILIGVNDVTRRYDTGDVTTPDEFRTSYSRLLETAASASTRIVLIEPFILPVAPRQVPWREDLAEKIEVVRDLVIKFDAEFIPADRILAQVAAESGPRPWCPDGVHPSLAGHRLLADEWLRLGLLE